MDANNITLYLYCIGQLLSLFFLLPLTLLYLYPNIPVFSISIKLSIYLESRYIYIDIYLAIYLSIALNLQEAEARKPCVNKLTFLPIHI